MAKNPDGTNGKGQPRAFNSGDELLECLYEYMNYCEQMKRFPNIAGFCVFNKGNKKNFLINKDTYYKQKEYYSDAYRICNDILEDGVLQDNTYRAQLYLKNKFGYSDKVENLNHTTDIQLSEEEADRILKKFGVNIE